jgi:hypothetical protein
MKASALFSLDASSVQAHGVILSQGRALISISERDDGRRKVPIEDVFRNDFKPLRFIGWFRPSHGLSSIIRFSPGNNSHVISAIFKSSF